jgi:hypothetical protein
MATGLSAFRLEMQRSGNYDKALQYAYDTTLNTQFDYSSEGAARIMREGGGVPLARLVFQFRRYQQAMLYLMFRNAKNLANPAERKEAAAALTYFGITSALAAGAMGLPFMGTALALVNLFTPGDDPEGDAETKLRNALFDLTGDQKLATVLAKGVPAMFGADLSQRIGLGDIASIFPMTRFDAKTGQDQVGKFLGALLGPTGGLAAQYYDAYTRFSEGDWAKGAEKLVPKFASDIGRATRYAFNGLTDGKGVPTGTELSAWDLTLRGLGVAPTAETNYYEGTRAIKSAEQGYNDRLTRIGREYKRGIRDGDMSSVREAIMEFNQRHPANPITPKKELQWRKEVREEGKNRASGSGVVLGQKTKAAFNYAGRFATQ